MRRRLLSLLLAFVMVLGMLPTTVLAEETAPQLTVTLEEQTLTVTSKGTYTDQAMGLGEMPWYQVAVPAGTEEGTALNMSYNGEAVPYLFHVNNSTPLETIAYYSSEAYGEFIACDISEDYQITPYCAVTFVEGEVETVPTNTAPALAGGEAAEAAVTVGEAYTLDLSTVFTDAEGDALTYQVSVNGGEAAAAEASYTYTPAEAGTTTLVFTANDGTADSPSYTVTLTAEAEPETETETPTTPSTPDTDDGLIRLTFEDADYKGGTNYAGGTNWSSLIDSAQYNGSLLYPTDATTAYNWYDEGNTYLKHAFADEWGDHQFWGGGHAISNYNSADYVNYGTYQHQLTVYNAGASGLATSGGGHNGSDNFAIHFGYVDDSGYSGTIQQSLTFGDGVARVIDHMYVNNTTYAMSCYTYGNDLTTAIAETDWVKLVATGHHADGTTATAEMYLVNGPSNVVMDWTKWDLSGLGEVTKVEFNVTGTSNNGYGFSQPGYFAYDDVAVRPAQAAVTPTDCLSVAENAATSGTIKAGELYELTLSEVFSDSEGHELTYSFESSVENQHTKIDNGVFYFSAAAGTYEVTLTAKCEGMEVSHKLSITVEAGNAGIEAQYNYDETDAASVTVYVTLSNDGYPLFANDTTMAHLEVTVPYFDLSAYGLEDYYRYGTTGGSGIYTSETVIKRPTGLHLYIYLLERYYMGLDEADCGKGSTVLSYAADTDVLYMDGTAAYSSNGLQALKISGGATSLYMVNFWGHDENLMYFRNHCYPFMSAGWGATSDYILLSDGDTWDVGMFSNWEFHNYGYFAKFDQDAYAADAGASVTVQTQKWGTTSSAVDFESTTGLSVALYNEEWEQVGEAIAYTEGTNSLTFTAPTAAGTYYLMALDPNAQNAEDACIAPATAILTVTGTVECETCTDEDTDKYCDVCGKDLNNLPTLAEGVEDRTITIKTGLAYQVDDIVNGNIFTDADGDSLTYTYRKSSDGGETWGDWNAFGEQMEHGTAIKTLTNSTAGTYTYEFKANDGRGDSEDSWFLTLETLDVVPATVNFYLSQDQNYSTNGNIYPILELYKTAGIDENQFDYIGWFTNAAGETEYVYNPQDYTIIDGETDYVVIDGVNYELHDYEKITFTDSLFGEEPAEGETATASGTVVSSYNMFYAAIESGRYSTRGYGWNTETSAYDIYLGGQSLELPMEEDIYGNGGGDIYLRVISVYTTSKKIDSTYFTADDYYVEMIMPVTGSMIHSGDAYVSGNYTRYPFLSYAAGNASLYNVYAYPYDTENYMFNQSINNTTSKGTSVVSKTITINTSLTLTAIVPQNADFGLYFQYNNFNTKEVAPEGDAVVNGDGTKTITYKVTKSNANYSWRLTDPSGTYATKAGWLASLTASAEKTFTYSTVTDKASHNFNRLGTAVTTRDEADLQVFVSSTGFKSISGTERIRAYRMWQIINSDTANIMIEPDFNLQVLQGNASDFKLVDGGNAVGNWMDVTPTTTSIIAVNYDTLDVYSTADNYGTHGGLYPATNPERTSVAVITNQTAGTADANISFNGSKDTDRGSAWDYNYDTWYYLSDDEAPTLDFTVTSSGDVSVSYATVITNTSLYSTLSGFNTITADESGNYVVSLLPFRNAGTLGGTVIIKMTDSTGTSYRLARVAEMTANVTNATNPGEPFQPGNDVSITYDGLYRSVNKISGVFNPTTYYLRYTADGTEVSSKVAQYQQMDTTTMTLTIPEDITFPEGETTVDYSFSNGYIYGQMYSASNPFDTMYYMTDTGMGTNFSAVGTTFVQSRIADIPVTVQQTEYYDMKIVVSDGEKELTDYTITLTSPDGTVLTPDENGVYQDLSYGSYPCSIVAAGFRNYNTALKIGAADAENVVDGVMTKTLVLEKGGEGVWDGTSATEPTAVDGIYQISTGAELAWFAQTVNAGTTDISAVLTRDIDLGYFAWTPIGTSSITFTGTLDGQNHKIYNLYISSTTGATYQGLFGYASGTIQNLTVDGSISSTSESSVSNAYIGGVAGRFRGTMTNVHSNVDITVTRVKGNWSYVGGLIGQGTSVELTNCSNTGDIVGYKNVGGLLGYDTLPTITACYNTGDISGYGNLAGIANSNNKGYITACYNTGNITGSSSYVVGIVTGLSANNYVKNCFNIGTIKGGTYSGAIIGRSAAATSIITDCYYYEDSYSAGGQNLQDHHETTAVSAETLASRDFVKLMNTGLKTPAYAVGTDHPILTWQDPSAEVIAPVLVSEMTLSAETQSLKVGETVQITATVNDDAEDKTLTWTSSDETIATVDETGLVTAVAAGEVTITATANDGSEYSAECALTVTTVVVAGDFNGDGTVNMIDVNDAFNAYMNEDELTEAQKAAVDANSNGVVDMTEVNDIFTIYMNE